MRSGERIVNKDDWLLPWRTIYNKLDYSIVMWKIINDFPFLVRVFELWLFLEKPCFRLSVCLSETAPMPIKIVRLFFLREQTCGKNINVCLQRESNLHVIQYIKKRWLSTEVKFCISNSGNIVSFGRAIAVKQSVVRRSPWQRLLKPPFIMLQSLISNYGRMIWGFASGFQYDSTEFLKRISGWNCLRNRISKSSNTYVRSIPVQYWQKEASCINKHLFSWVISHFFDNCTINILLLAQYRYTCMKCIFLYHHFDILGFELSK